MEDEEEVQERDRENGSSARARLDKWLWAARFFKARALAAQAADGGRVKVNGERVKSSREIRVGDRVAIQLGEFEWEVDVTHLSAERGGATIGGALYEETDDSRDRRALVIANRNAHPEPAWSREGGDGERSRGRRRPSNGRVGNRGATAAFLSPETSPSQLVAAVTGTANGGARPTPASAPSREPNRKPRRRRRGRGGRVRGASPGGAPGGGEAGGDGGGQQA